MILQNTGCQGEQEGSKSSKEDRHQVHSVRCPIHDM
jgi:hypothetical protein